MNRLTVLGGSSGPTSLGPACFLLDTEKYRIIVDCGEEFVNVASVTDGQRVVRRTLRGPNLNYLLDGRKVDAVILTHGHLDHVGMVPKLAPYLAAHAKIWASSQTHMVARLLWNDNLKFNPTGFGLYQVIAVSREWRKGQIEPGENELLPGLRVFTVPAGHVPGAFSVIVKLPDGRNALFAGDQSWHDQPVVGRADLLSTVVPPNWWPDMVLSTDLTSGFANRRRDYDDELRRLGTAVREVLARGGKAIVAAFAFGRGQNAALELARLDLPVPLYVDGAIRQVFQILQENSWSPKDQTEFSLEGINFVGSNRERKELSWSPQPLVVVTTSGMGDGGPFAQWARYALADKKNAVFFIGYQAHGSTGLKILGARDGDELELSAGPKVDELGRPIETVKVPIRAQRERFHLTAHGDPWEVERFLGDIVSGRRAPIERLVITHATPESQRFAAFQYRRLADEIIFGGEGTVIRL